MKILFLTNSYTKTAAPYIRKLLDENLEIAGVFLLNQVSIERIIKKATKFGIGHILKRAMEAIKARIIYLFSTGRKKKAKQTYNSIEELIRDYSLPAYRVLDINAKNTINKIKELSPDIIFVCTFSQILKKEIIEIAKLGCINIHAGLLPKYRGPASNFWVLYNGEEKTGITFHYLTTAVDNGDILLQKELKIMPDDIEETLDIRLAELGTSVIVKLVNDVYNGSVVTIPQKEEEASYFTQPTTKQRCELSQKRKR